MHRSPEQAGVDYIMGSLRQVRLSTEALGRHVLCQLLTRKLQYRKTWNGLRLTYRQDIYTWYDALVLGLTFLDFLFLLQQTAP